MTNKRTFEVTMCIIFLANEVNMVVFLSEDGLTSTNQTRCCAGWQNKKAHCSMQIKLLLEKIGAALTLIPSMDGKSFHPMKIHPAASPHLFRVGWIFPLGWTSLQRVERGTSTSFQIHRRGGSFVWAGDDQEIAAKSDRDAARNGRGSGWANNP